MCLERAGDLQGAQKAFQGGLDALEAGIYMYPDTPRWRETHRLQLLLYWVRGAPHAHMHACCLNAMYCILVVVGG